MRLVIQIPCFNEEATLPAVVADLPRHIPGIDDIRVLVIDDGSTDRTVEVARRLGVDHILGNRVNQGLARTFQAGIDHALALGADIIVNTDGDNQYAGASIPDLVRPVVEGRAEVVIGDRRPDRNPEFPFLKRRLQWLGSRVVGRLAGVAVGDAVSGFRAYSRDAALKLNVMTAFSYTTETLIHAGQGGLRIVSVPVATNPATRPSRLSRSMWGFLWKQLITIVRSVFMYRALSAFVALGLGMVLLGTLPILRFLYFYVSGDGDGHIQSLVLGSLCFALGFMTLVIAFLGDAVATNRRLLEKTLERVRRLELAARAGDDPDAAG
ncbi:Glycosyltransferase involved in cell wall bisynthesis [Roseospirillum parvum]|uniref:Glycosyltransferase involved in cell wall bisynthesis n=1 Tax=Roseospirillum parvum TaxID=83401 RepID=A0A1G8CZN7_9PROT|nr:Glycosyltransferase involved in cell wall bisynthesis [Roseospirillum parvum]